VFDGSWGACLRARRGEGLLRIDAGGVDFLQIPGNSSKFVETFIARRVTIKREILF